ncbi:MAG TPA: AAA family ATPase, partial [Candidatus Cloacimonas sp.]|nr:AAA family ATPase [Candidatus Cloacimonas sp.]
MIKRFITSRILNNLHKGKVILIMGARQSGKTTLLKGLFPDQQDVLYLNCDDLEDRNLLAAETISSMKQFAGKSKYILIDEAQRVQNI